MSEEHYSYRVRWSPEDAGFVGTVVEFPSLSWIDETQRGAFDGIRTLVGEVLADMQANGEEPPAALADRQYSGRFVVRVPPELHRRLALDAAEQGVSLNRLVASRVALG
ncbi:type II toxin-antitoxin system HicB family antitoxin [Brevibacterium litoralis]|uniref:type II toxin-antitoxin system HicB family antitoxin n=1 Tax=Brevibacterium litoralis TaxID=3138935 RepID=UPI0032EAE9B3